MERLVDVDDVLDLFGCSDEDIYGKYTIEDALYDGSLKTTEVVRCKECKYWKDKYGCADSEEPKFCYNWGTKFAKDHNYKSRTPDDFCSRGERK